MEKIKWSEKVIKEQIIGPIGEKRTLLNNTLRTKVNWIGHILRINCLLHDGRTDDGSERSRMKKNTAP